MIRPSHIFRFNLGILFLLCALSALAGGVPWRKSLDAAMEEALSTKRMVMVFYHVDFCDWCEKMDEQTFSNSRVIKELRSVVPVKLNAKGQSAFAKKYDLKGFPSVVFIEPDGKKWGDMFGYVPPNLFSDELKKFVNAHNDWPEIQADYRENPTDGDTNARMAWVYGIRRMEDPALTHLARANRARYKGPYLARANNMIGDIYQLSDRVDQAIPFFKRALDATTDVADKSYSLVSLASCYRALGKWEEMKNYARQLINLKGATPEYVEFARELLRGSGQIKREAKTERKAPLARFDVKTRVCVAISGSLHVWPLMGPLAKAPTQSLMRTTSDRQAPSLPSLAHRDFLTPHPTIFAPMVDGIAKP